MADLESEALQQLLLLPKEEQLKAFEFIKALLASKTNTTDEQGTT